MLFALIQECSGQYLMDDAWKERVKRIAATEGLDVGRLAAEARPLLKASSAGPSRAVILLEQAAAAQLVTDPVDEASRELERIDRELKYLRRMKAAYLGDGATDLAAMQDTKIAECETRARTLRAEAGAA